MGLAIKTCPTCGQANRAASGFCPNCGLSLASVAPTTIKSATASPALFPVPAFLEHTQKKRRRMSDDRGGGGLVWLGFFLVAIPIVLSHGSSLATTIWGAGLLVVVGGFWRMRQDGHALLRAGMATNLLALAALAGIAVQLAATRGNSPAGNAARTVAAATATPDWLVATNAAAAPTPVSFGSVSMYRGVAAHTGANPGPGPLGQPFRKWRFDTGGEVSSSPAVAGGLVFFGSKDGFLHAVDVGTGRDRWEFDLGGYPVRSSPAVVDKTVYVGVGYTLYAINAETGQERWHFAMRYAGESSPTVVDGIVYVASKESLVYAVEAASGAEKWHFTTEGLIFSSPAVANGVVYLGSDDGNLYAIDAKSGQSKWKFATGGEVYSSPAVAGNRVYVTSKSRSIIAVDVATGKELWHYPIGGESSPAVVNGDVYVGGDDGGIYALDATSGALKWLFATGRPITASPSVAGRVVYVPSGPNLFAVDDQTGHERWHYPTGDEIETAPTIVDGMVYIGDRDGYLYAIAGDGVGDGTPAAGTPVVAGTTVSGPG